MKLKTNVFWGIVIIGVGLVVLLNMLDIYFYFASRFIYFVVGCLLVVYGVNEFVQKKRNFLVFFTIYLGIGFILFMLGSQIAVWHLRGITSPWAFAGPAAILAVGTSMIMKQSTIQHEQQSTMYNSQEEQSPNRFTTTEDRLSIHDMFSSSFTVVTSMQLQSGAITSRFSETVVDLRHTQLSGDVFLDIDVLFGSVKIIVSQDIYTKINSKANIFSSVNKNIDIPLRDGAQKLTLNTTILFGEIEIEYV